MTQLEMFPAPVPAAPSDGCFWCGGSHPGGPENCAHDNVPRGTFPLVFPAHPDCTLCKLYTTAAHAGVPTRALLPASTAGAAVARSPRALVAIGMNPGYNEELENTCWIGWSGRLLTGLLTDFVEATPANGIDVYLSNTARCRTPGTAKVTISIRKACFAHLRADLAQITTAYGEGNVSLLLLGAEACWLADGLSIRKSVGTQGLPRHLHIWPEGPVFPCFFTYHPAATAPGRDPALLGAIEDHLRFLRDSLFGAAPAPSLPPSAAILRAPRTLPPAPLYSLDIETYGILRGRTQTVFHPARMVSSDIDDIPLDKMIVCCALSWYDEADQLHSAWYNLYNGRDIISFHGAIRFIARHRPTLIGQNITFDLSCLRFRFPLLRPLLVCRNFTLDDTTITNHLDSDIRPERTLKAQSRLFRSVDYDALSISAARPEDQARSPEDPNLLLYNVADTIACLRARRRHLSNIAERFGPLHPALTPFGRQFRSELIWLVLHMTESGCAFDRRRLEEVHTTQSTLCKELILSAYSHDLIVAGNGTEASQRALFTAAASACGALDDSRLELTAQRKEISTGKANTNLFLGLLPLAHPLRRPLEILRNYKTASKLVSSYTTKLLHQPSEGCHLVGGSTSRALWMAFPSWYPTPGHVQDTGEEGGTRQGRFAAKKPAQQTLPPLVKACRTSRYGDDGILADFDMCLAGSTEIYTCEGIRTIKDVAETGTKGVLACSHTGQLSFVPPTKMVVLPPQFCVRLTVSGGADGGKGVKGLRGTVVCTPEHKWLDWYGNLVRTDTLHVGDRLAHVHCNTPSGGYPCLTVGIKGRLTRKIRPVRLHKLVAACWFGDCDGKHVHHADGNKTNWVGHNLRILIPANHFSGHYAGKGNPNFGRFKLPPRYCLTCGAAFRAPPSRSAIYCSRKCYRNRNASNFRVVAVEPVSDTATTVYCLRVPPYSTFVLANGLVSSNSQMELRTAALLSGDPVMISTYQDPSRDIHTDTTLEVWPSAVPILDRADPLYHDWYVKRQLGKRGNFLVIYRGGPRALVETARRYAAIEVPLPLAEHIVYSIRRRFARLCQWQEELIDEAHTQGHLLLDTGWMRTFGGATREDTADSYINEIANFPVQTTAAQCVQSAQTVILERRQSQSLTFVIPQQDHDSITIDCHRSNWPATRAMVVAAMTLPPLWRYYCEKLHRPVPLAVDCTIAYRGVHCATLT